MSPVPCPPTTMSPDPTSCVSVSEGGHDNLSMALPPPSLLARPLHHPSFPSKPLQWYLGVPGRATQEFQPSSSSSASLRLAVCCPQPHNGGPCHYPCRGACWGTLPPCPGGCSLPSPGGSPSGKPGRHQMALEPPYPGWELGARRMFLPQGCVGCT